MSTGLSSIYDVVNGRLDCVHEQFHYWFTQDGRWTSQHGLCCILTQVHITVRHVSKLQQAGEGGEKLAADPE